MDKNIIGCKEAVYYKRKTFSLGPSKVLGRPKTMYELGAEVVVGRKIIGWSANLGSYGMGGPGFFGLQLEKSKQRPEESLVLILWGADEWLLFDRAWVAAHPKYYSLQKPLYSGFSDKSWDKLSRLLKGSIIQEAIFEKLSTKISLKKGRKAHILEIPENTKLLPHYGGGKVREWHAKEDQRKAWVMTKYNLWTDD